MGDAQPGVPAHDVPKPWSIRHRLRKLRATQGHILEHDIGLVIQLSLLFCIDTLWFALYILSYIFTIIKALVLYIVLRAVRLVIEKCASGVATFLSAAFHVIDSVVNVILDGVHLVAEAVSDVSFGAVHFDVGHIHLSDDASGIMDALEAPHSCDAIDTISDEMLGMVRMHTHPLCGVVRYTYPVDFVYRPLDTIFGPLIFNPDPSTSPGCQTPEFMDFCLVFNSYQLVRLFLYGLVLYCFFKAYWPTIRFFVWRVAVPFVVYAVQVFRNCLHSIWQYLTKLSNGTQPSSAQSLQS
jgi:hypothetical protein